MTWKYRYRKQIALGSGVLFLIAIVSFFIVRNTFTTKTKKEEKVSFGEIRKKETNTKKEQVETVIKVDVKGEVVSPGLYHLTEEERVIDAINKAGGLTDYADVSVINLSKKLKDEMVIIIYSKQDVKDFKKTKEIEKQSIELCQQKDEQSLYNDACISSSIEKGQKQLVNINTATFEQLITLSGIGDAKAQDIINYREANGPFTKIEDIKNVTGIGDNLFAKIKDFITI